MNWKTLAPLAVALVLGLIAAVLARQMIADSARAEAEERFAKVVVARQDVLPGTELTEAHVTVGQIAAETAPGTACTNYEEVVGRVITAPLVKGQPVLTTMLAPEGVAAGLQALVPDGMRAMTLEVNEVNSVAGLLTPGCRVDVVATIHDRGEGESLARTIVENVQVTAVGKSVARGQSEDDGYKTVTLLVTPQQVEAIELASATTRPRLVLRSGRDADIRQSDGVSLSALRSGISADVPPMVVPPVETVEATAQVQTTPAPQQPNIVAVGAPRPMRTIEVIRGGAVSTVNMELPAPPQAVSNALEP